MKTDNLKRKEENLTYLLEQVSSKLVEKMEKRKGNGNVGKDADRAR